MKFSSGPTNVFCLLLLLPLLLAYRADSGPTPSPDYIYQKFVDCISSKINPSTQISSTIYTHNNASFKAVLGSTARNPRCLWDNVPKPALIFMPLSEPDVQAAVVCAKQYNFHIRTRSGGHDYECSSFASQAPSSFILIDLQKLRTILINTDDNTAWVSAGATNGELYKRIADQSDVLAFPAGFCDSLGMGGHITGGGYGPLMRKYGLGADNVIDAFMVDANGKILDRKTMGEDVFWAIRGGGGGSFGIILSWKLKLVAVPKTVTFFSISKSLPRATDLIVKWQQVSSELDDRLHLGLFFTTVVEKKAIRVMVTFEGDFLGDAKELLDVMKHKFPELGVTPKDCNEMSWIESVLRLGQYPNGTSQDILLEVVPTVRNAFKAKSDFVTKDIPRDGLLGLWNILMQNQGAFMVWSNYGGEVNRIGTGEIAFAHRHTKFIIGYVVGIQDPKQTNSAYAWIRRLHLYMTPFVSANPRLAYVNYKDLDLGVNNNSKSDYSVARTSWGIQYFNQNFERLVWVKQHIDPTNFFRHEQSIPLP